MTKTVKSTILLALAWFVCSAAILQQTVEPPVYPEGVYCTPRGTEIGNRIVDPAHKCDCHHMGDDPDCPEGHVAENSRCKQWCHKEHCHCPVECPDSQDNGPR